MVLPVDAAMSWLPRSSEPKPLSIDPMSMSVDAQTQKPCVVSHKALKPAHSGSERQGCCCPVRSQMALGRTTGCVEAPTPAPRDPTASTTAIKNSRQRMLRS
jgi:hypothetical protein